MKENKTKYLKITKIITNFVLDPIIDGQILEVFQSSKIFKCLDNSKYLIID